MSRIGRLPVAIPAGVTVEVAEGNKVTVKGSKGTLVRVLPAEMDIKVEDGHVVCKQTKRSEENEISARSDKNTDPQHGSWCQRRIMKRSWK